MFRWIQAKSMMMRLLRHIGTAMSLLTVVPTVAGALRSLTP
jgi:hypothetical protein